MCTSRTRTPRRAHLADYVEVPGPSGITLPSEESPANDEVMLQGVGQAAGFGSPGSIVVPLARLNQHPTHRLLTQKNIAGGKVLARVIRPAEAVVSYLNATANVAPAIAAGAGGISVVSGAKFSAVRPGMYVAWGANLAAVNAQEAASAAGDDGAHWRPIIDVADDFNSFRIGFGVAGAVAAGNAVNVFVRIAGMEWLDLLCSVGTMGKGEMAAAQSVAGNLVLRPDADIGLSTIYMGTSA